MMNDTLFLKELSQVLGNSSAADRQVWAKRIVDDEISIDSIWENCLGEPKVERRLSWLLSDVGLISPSYLRKALPIIWSRRMEITHFEFENSFLKYWRICGVPELQHNDAICLIFGKLNSNELDVSHKYNAIQVMLILCDKYPDLVSEFTQRLDLELGLRSENFD